MAGKRWLVAAAAVVLQIALGAEYAWSVFSKPLQARLHLRQGQLSEAQRVFDQVCFDLPGELAPKLALGLAAELGGDRALAEQMYAVVTRVDPTMVSAVFGLARCLRADGRAAAAVEVREKNGMLLELIGCLSATGIE